MIIPFQGRGAGRKNRSATPRPAGAVVVPLDSASTSHKMREALQVSVEQRLSFAIPKHEIEAHFTQMPERYWARVDENELLRHLEVIHLYIERAADMDSEGTIPIVCLKHIPDRGYSEVVICTSDQHGLLAKIAGSFAAVHINVFSADIYTRKDKLALDIFHACDSEYRPILDKARIEKMQETLFESLTKHGDLPFTELLSFEDEDMTARFSRQTEKSVVTTVTFDNKRSAEYTILEVQTGDHLGLLHDILQVLTLCDLEIGQAKINTENGMAVDAFYLTDPDGNKILSNARLDLIRKQLLKMIEQHPMPVT